MENRKLGKATDKRMALLRGQVTDLLWYGRIETTYDRAKEVQKMAEKLLTKAINSYKDTVKKVETRQRKKKDKKGNETVEEYKIELINDGPTKLAARRAIMSVVYDVKEIIQSARRQDPPPACGEDLQRVRAQIRRARRGKRHEGRLYPRAQKRFPPRRRSLHGDHRTRLRL